MNTGTRTLPGLLLLAVSSLLAGDSCPCTSTEPLGPWCVQHHAATIAGVKISSHELFETLDAHGHVLGLDRGCDTCEVARKTDGYCESHGIGFVDDLGYMSRLTYHLAKATPTDPGQLACLTCREHAASHGWCDTCGRGMVGNVAVDRREDYEALAKAYRTLIAANEMAARCELCASAMVIERGFCPEHRIRYENGKPIETKP